jgi:hypothetical protein
MALDESIGHAGTGVDGRAVEPVPDDVEARTDAL